MRRLIVCVIGVGLLVACGDEGSSPPGGGGGSAPTIAVTVPSNDAQPNATVTSQTEANPVGTATPDPTATRIVGTATNEPAEQAPRATVTPDDRDLPLGGN